MKLLNLFLCLMVLGFSHAASAQSITTVNKTFEANNVSILVQIDTIIMIDPVTGEEFIRFEKLEKIQSLNGKDIYYGNEASEPVGAASQSDIKTFISSLVNEDLKNAKDVHNIDVIIDEEGNLGFLRFQLFKGGNGSEKEIEPIRRKIIEKLKGVHFIPAKHNGKAVPYGTAIMVIK